MEKEYEEYSKADREWWAEQEKERVAQLKLERKSALEHQKRLARMTQVGSPLFFHRLVFTGGCVPSSVRVPAYFGGVRSVRWTHLCHNHFLSRAGQERFHQNAQGRAQGPLQVEAEGVRG